MEQKNEYMTLEEYETYVRLQKQFINCLEQCAVEISWLEFKRAVVGEFCVDYELYESDKYMVQFESYCCGESDYDTVFVPVMYIHDKGYREYYEKHLESVKLAEAEAKELEKQRTQYVYDTEEEMAERAEYERLKKKFEDG